ncbi:hypothetical protein PSHT_07623 [Puccinia striiformis]|nr:hypothetical protein PSTT_07485 [Puccinia striiformis]POW13733.1 hypothetical protein PSHT_07623 [Puccinia striiformis]
MAAGRRRLGASSQRGVNHPPKKALIALREATEALWKKYQLPQEKLQALYGRNIYQSPAGPTPTRRQQALTKCSKEFYAIYRLKQENFSNTANLRKLASRGLEPDTGPRT